MKQFRLRIQNGRVIGPFSEEQVISLMAQDKLKAHDEIQEFPTGNWAIISTMQWWSGQTPKAKAPAAESTFVFQLPSKDQLEIIHEETEGLPKKEEKSSVNLQEFDYRNFEKTEDILPPKVERPKKISEDPEFEKTRIRSNQIVNMDEKTIINTEAQRNRPPEIKVTQVDDDNESNDINEDLPQKVDKNEETQIQTLEDFKLDSEEELLSVEESFENSPVKIKKPLEKSQEKIFTQTLVKKKNNKILFYLLVPLLLLALFFPEDDKKKANGKSIEIVYPEIVFPLPFDEVDKYKGDDLYKKALVELAQHTYVSTVNAAKLFRESYENNSSNKSALFKLIRLYAQLLPHSDKFEYHSNVVFKLLQANLVSKDVNSEINLAWAYFYKAMGKENAAFDALNRFVKSNSGAPIKEHFAEYLTYLCKRNIEVKADEVASSLEKVTDKSPVIYEAIFKYYKYKNYPDRYTSILNEGLKKYPESVVLKILQNELLLHEGNIKQLATNNKLILSLNAESSRVYYSRYLEFEAYVMLSQKKPEEANKLFLESLKFYDTDGLIERLNVSAHLKSFDKNTASPLMKILFAKSLIQKASLAWDKFDYEGALFLALEANELKTDYIPARLFMAKIQFKLGLVGDGLATLEKVYKENGNNKDVSLALAKAYISYFKFLEAKKIMSIMATSDEFRSSWDYSFLNADLYEKNGDINQSIIWLYKSFQTNPLSDEVLFRLAKLLSKAKKIKEAKNFLFKAMELDPMNIDYKITYAEIIYEADGADEAVSYLFGLLKQFPQHPAILGELSIYYYRSGKYQNFLDTKKELEQLSIKDPRVYKFLIKVSMLEDRPDDAVKYMNDLSKLDPGDLETPMELGKYLMSIRKLREAAVWFKEVMTKLPNYPKVGYFKAKIELFLNNTDQAILDLQEDIKINGEYEDALVLLGDIYRKVGKFNEAENQYKSILKISTKSSGALKGLGILATGRQQYDVALDLFRRAASEERQGQRDADLYRQMGDLYRITGQGALAIETYNEYLRLAPEAADKSEVEGYIKTLE